jgi:hypothetical protein
MVDDSWHGGRSHFFKLSFLSASIFAIPPSVLMRAMRCRHGRNESSHYAKLEDCSSVDHRPCSLRMGNREYGPIVAGAVASSLASSHAVVEIENVKLDLVLDPILGPAGHLEHAENAARVPAA